MTDYDPLLRRAGGVCIAVAGVGVVYLVARTVAGPLLAALVAVLVLGFALFVAGLPDETAPTADDLEDE